MMQNLDDIAGIRVICSFIDDIYEISKMLARQDDVKVIAIKDYIRCPKENGYRSYHMIILPLTLKIGRASMVDKSGSADQDDCHGFLGQSGSPA